MIPNPDEVVARVSAAAPRPIAWVIDASWALGKWLAILTPVFNGLLRLNWFQWVVSWATDQGRVIEFALQPLLFLTAAWRFLVTENVLRVWNFFGAPPLSPADVDVLTVILFMMSAMLRFMLLKINRDHSERVLPESAEFAAVSAIARLRELPSLVKSAPEPFDYRPFDQIRIRNIQRLFDVRASIVSIAPLTPVSREFNYRVGKRIVQLDNSLSSLFAKVLDEVGQIPRRPSFPIGIDPGEPLIQGEPERVRREVVERFEVSLESDVDALLQELGDSLYEVARSVIRARVRMAFNLSLALVFFAAVMIISLIVEAALLPSAT